MRHLRPCGLTLVLLALLAALPLACHRPDESTGRAPDPGAAAQDPSDDPPDGPPWFEDVTDKAGLDFVHDAGAVDGRHFMPQIVGSGTALFDFDGDGLLDIYLLQNGGPKGARNQLYKQLPGGRFHNVSAGSGLDVAGYNMGVAVGDIDNDGRPDVLVTQYCGVKLFLNLGGGKFRDVTAAAGLEDTHWATSAAFFDYDQDGRLDLVIANYVEYDPTQPCTSPGGTGDYCAPKTFPGTSSQLYRNLGPAGVRPGSRCPVRFQDVSVSSGLGLRAGPGLGVVCADFNGDGWPDVLIANDGKPNHLWINQKNGTFREEAVRRGLAYNAMGQAEANMGIGLGDVDGDGLEDVFVTHLSIETNTLWMQGPRGLFRDRTAFSGLARPRWRATGFGCWLGDFDRDGALDAVLVNGRVAAVVPSARARADLGPHWGRYGERNQVFANDGTGRFQDVSLRNPALCRPLQIGRGIAVGDVDNDGGLDLLVTTVAGRARLFKNVAAASGAGHWLLVRAFDPDRKRDALGAEVTVRAGGRRVRTVHAGGSFLCSNDPRAHFGLGKADRVEAIEVRWPGGGREVFRGPDYAAVDRIVTLTRGKGKPAQP